MCSKTGESLLNIALSKRTVYHSRTVTEKGASINLCTKKTDNLNLKDCRNGLESIVQLLLESRGNIYLNSDTGGSPLLVACAHGHDSAAQLLLNTNAAVNDCVRTGESPLYIACQNGHGIIAKLSLKKEQTSISAQKIGNTPLFKSCSNEHELIVQLLLSNRADIIFSSKKVPLKSL